MSFTLKFGDGIIIVDNQHSCNSISSHVKYVYLSHDVTLFNLDFYITKQGVYNDILNLFTVIFSDCFASHNYNIDHVLRVLVAYI